MIASVLLLSGARNPGSAMQGG